jgi:hypothetical protein
MSEEIKSLGRYIPSAYQSEIIEAEIRAFLPECCRCERISVRYPNGAEPPYDNLQWHQDGGGKEGTTRHMVVWASEMATHIRTSDGVIVDTQPFDVIWFDNDRAFHKQPENTRGDQRWFVSVRCSGKVF